MPTTPAIRLAICLIPTFVLTPHPASRATRYDDLVALFTEWRTFQKPRVVHGVPDYSAAAMATQHRGLAAYERRLAAIDTTGWSVPERVDYVLVHAEMNGLDFDHRVMRPWAKSPSFYIMFFPGRSDQPVREGPHAYGTIELWTYALPLTPDRAAALRTQLRTIPPLYEQAKRNLVDHAHDFWVLGIREMKLQSEALTRYAASIASSNPDLGPDVDAARAATDQMVAWLERELPSRTGPSGIGVDNYDWYLRNVQLVPYTWAEEQALLTSELGRGQAALRLEEVHDRDLPAAHPIASAEEYRSRFDSAVTEYMGALRGRDILTVRDYMEPALRARGHFTPPDQFEFFNQVNDRDPIVMLAHDFHWFDMAQWERRSVASPIRREALLYNIFDTRTEGFASALEEMMTDAGVYDGHPRVRELIYAIIAERAAVAMGDLRMHSNEYTIDRAVQFAAAETPRGWLSAASRSVWGADGEGLYLVQPGYGTSYTVGKIMILRLLGERAGQIGDAFTLRGFIDEFTAVGLIPVSLIRWELTGHDDEVRGLATGR
jgi:hypothetical protein